MHNDLPTCGEEEKTTEFARANNGLCTCKQWNLHVQITEFARADQNKRTGQTQASNKLQVVCHVYITAYSTLSLFTVSATTRRKPPHVHDTAIHYVLLTLHTHTLETDIP